VNVVTARTIVGLIAGIYVVGVVLHFWYIILAIVVLILLASVKRSKPSAVPAATLAEARKIQSYYSNRR
jgi:ABC-type spermidine/putrescine transport system permease subunit I